MSRTLRWLGTTGPLKGWGRWQKSGWNPFLSFWKCPLAAIWSPSSGRDVWFPAGARQGLALVELRLVGGTGMNQVILPKNVIIDGCS